MPIARGRTPLPPLSLTAWLRYDLVRRLLPEGAQRVLEIGAGVGSIGALLARRLEYVGLEPDPASYAIAARRVGKLGLVLNTTAEEFASDGPFDLVCAFEVLEHIEDDRAALAGWLRHLAPGGTLMVSVPLGRERYGPWDEKAGHIRRYDREEIAARLEETGLASVVAVPYGFPLGSASEAVRALLARRRRDERSLAERTAASGRNYQPPAWAAYATWLAAAPFRILQRPFQGTDLGPGVVASGRLPQSVSGSLEP
ncbi:MAG TPA: class I SAM-dependent methyltransferase [Gaiellaceae bacterium]|nr:class I SAM-dependent methyltransferase [Gaiellaceae bacterium]